MVSGGEIRAHHFGAGGSPPLEAISVFELSNRLVVETARELDAGNGRGRSGLLEGSKGTIEIYGHVVGSFANGIPIGTVVLGNFHKKFLGVVAPKIESRGFEHQSL